jgi:hypothetical protein
MILLYKRRSAIDLKANTRRRYNDAKSRRRSATSTLNLLLLLLIILILSLRRHQNDGVLALAETRATLVRRCRLDRATTFLGRRTGSVSTGGTLRRGRWGRQKRLGGRAGSRTRAVGAWIRLRVASAERSKPLLHDVNATSKRLDKRLTMWRARSSRPSRAVPTLSMPFTSNNVSSSPLGFRVPPCLTPLRTKASSSLTNWRCAAVNAATLGLSSSSSTPRRSAARTRELNRVLNSTGNGLHSLWSRAQREHFLVAVASHAGGPARSRTLEQRLQHTRRSFNVGATRRARGVAHTLC